MEQNDIFPKNESQQPGTPIPSPEQEPQPIEESVATEPVAPQTEEPAAAGPVTPGVETPVTPCVEAPVAPVVVVEKRQKNGVWLAIAIIAVCISLLMGAFAIWAAKNSPQAFDIPQSSTPSYNYRDNVEEGDALTPQEIIAKVSPSVVTVSVEGVSEGQVASGFGTGIIYTDNGYILTNAHVVEGANRISVTDYNGKTYAASLIGADSESDTAVIKIEATGLAPAEFGESSKVVPGDMVIAIGTPYNENLSYTATQGMVSAIREGLNFPELGYTLDLIQHDAPINSGNSGGPLVNVYGQVIGINSIKISGTYENLGFALQIDDVLPLAEELMSTGKISRPGIGITGYTYESGDLKGAFVYTVVPGGPADKAGLKTGDIIIKANDTTIETIDQLKEILQSAKIGDSVSLTYLRDNAVHTTTLVLEELNAQ